MTLYGYPYSDISSTSVTMSSCKHCEMIHGGVCPKIKAIEYYPDGSIRRVEYYEFKAGQGWEWTVDWQGTGA